MSRLILLLLSITCSVLTAPSLDPALRTCEPIRVDLCRGLGYNATGMPNLIGHELQSDADFTLKTFTPLIQYGCSAQLHFFLCSVYVPMCTEKALAPIGPCRGLCESVKARCYPVLQGFGFPWPAGLDCQRFPSENNHEHMCMEGPGEGLSSDTNTAVVRTTPVTGPPCQRLAKPQLYTFVNRSGRCAPLCGADVLFEAPDKRLAEVWSSAWGALGLAASVMALLIVVAAPSGGTEPGLWPLCLCHAASAFGWGVRALVGRSLVSCGRDVQAPAVTLLLSDGLSNANCTVVFLLMYYFTMAAAVWHALLCWSWLRSLGAGSAPPSGAVQAIAWGVPGMMTAAALVARLVDADELTGACFVGNQSDRALLLLVALPLAMCLCAGVGCLLAGAMGFHRKSPAPGPLAQVLPGPHRTTWCLALYVVPSVAIVATYFYEYASREDWLSAPRPTLQPSALPKAPLWPFLLRTLCSFAGCAAIAAWSLAPRALQAWRRVCGGVAPAVYKPAPIKCAVSAAQQSHHYFKHHPPHTCSSHSMISTKKSRQLTLGGETVL